MTFSVFGPNYQQRDIRLFFEQNSHQLGFVAHHIHLCSQARMSDESLLAPHPRLSSLRSRAAEGQLDDKSWTSYLR